MSAPAPLALPVGARWPEGRSALGEGPCWCDGHLYWVDIRAGCVWRARAGRPAERVLQLAETVSAVVPAVDGSLLVTGRHVVYHWDGNSRDASPLVRLPDEPPGNRCNEARCDPWGNLWVGTMDKAGHRPSGALWCLTTTGELEKVLAGITIPNTLAWDATRARLYLGDSSAGVVDIFDFDPTSRALGAQRPFLAQGAAPGVPDGSALDDEGCLWNARWDGSCVVRIAPSGRIVGTVALQATRPTSCVFGDGELFVTTAMPDDTAAACPADGVVWSVRTPVGGEASGAYAGPTRAADIRVTRMTAATRWRAR